METIDQIFTKCNFIIFSLEKRLSVVSKIISNNEKEKRRAVWLALSEFYLDTELDDEDLVRISTVFKKSGYSLDQIKEINNNEVGPVLYMNYFTTAGEWIRFEPRYLFNSIETEIETKNKWDKICDRIIRPLIRNKRYFNRVEILLNSLK